MTLIERNPNAPDAWQGNLPVTNRYTFGIAGEHFFRAIKDEAKIMGTYCPHCNYTYVPATSFCEKCLRQLTDWVDVGTHGTIHTFTLLYENIDGSQKATPDIIAYVRLGDGGLIHKLDHIDPDQVVIGMEVAAIFKPLEDRQGSIEDIIYFEPLEK
jgi:uncharacterized OB-fold protein